MDEMLKLVNIFYVRNKENIHFVYGYSIDLEERFYIPSEKVEIDIVEKGKDLKLGRKSVILTTKEYEDIVVNTRGIYNGIEIFNISIDKIDTDFKSEYSFLKRPPIKQYGDCYIELPENKKPESISGFLSEVTSYWPFDSEDKRRSGYYNKVDLLKSVFSIDTTKAQSIEDFELFRIFSIKMKELSGLSFNNKYMKRLFNFEEFFFPLGGAIQNPPVRIKTNKVLDDKKKTMYVNSITIYGCLFEKDEGFLIQVAIENADDIVVDEARIIKPKSSEESRTFKSKEPISGFEIKVYKESGKLLFQEKVGLIREIHFNMAVIGQEMQYSDDFSLKKEKTTDVNEIKKIKKISDYSLSIVNDQSYDPWRKQINLISQFSRTLKNNYCNTLIVKTGAENEVEGLVDLKKMLDSDENKFVVYVDPFFSIHAFSKLVPRLSNMSCEFVFISSLVGKDPDTDTKIEDQTKKLKEFCGNYSSILPNKFKFYNVVKGKERKEQAFHDRFLILHRQNGNIITYMLSNSINQISAKYPLTITNLSREASLEIREYAIGLINEKDILDNSQVPKTLKTETIWDYKENKPNKVFNDYRFPFAEELKKMGIETANEDCQFFKEIQLESLTKKIDAQNIEQSAIVLYSIGEFFARNSKNEKKENFVEKFKCDDVLNFIVKKLYEKEIGGLKNDENLNIDMIYGTILKRKFDYSLFSDAKRNIIYFEGHAHGLINYGLSFVINQLIEKDMKLFIEWFEKFVSENDKKDRIKSFVLHYLTSKIAFTGSEEVKIVFSKSKIPFIGALGIVSLGRKDFFNNQNIPIKNERDLLKLSGVEEKNIIWILADRICGYDINIARGKKLIEESRKINETIEFIVENWPKQEMDDFIIEQLNNAIRDRSYYRAKLIENLEKKGNMADAEKLHKINIRKFDELVGLIEKKESRKSVRDFHFYAKEDGPLLIYSGHSFYSIHKDETIRKLRNKYSNLINNLYGTVSFPFSRNVDHNRWSDSTGILAAVLIFYFNALRSFIEKNPDKKSETDSTFKYIFEVSKTIIYQYFKEERSTREDLMEMLVREMAFSVENFNNEEYEKIINSTSDVYLKSLFSYGNAELFEKYYEKCISHTLKDSYESEEADAINKYYPFVGQSLTYYIKNSTSHKDDILKHVKKFHEKYNGKIIEPIDKSIELFLNSIEKSEDPAEALKILTDEEKSYVCFAR